MDNGAILASFFLFACFKAGFRLSLSTRNKKKRTITSKKHAYRPETSYVLYYSLKKNLNASTVDLLTLQVFSTSMKLVRVKRKRRFDWSDDLSILTDLFFSSPR